MKILDHITENNSFVSKSRPSREEDTSSHKDILVAESDLPLPTTSNYFCKRKPLVPVASTDPMEAALYRENVKKLMSSE
jgi:hypothetical protein